MAIKVVITHPATLHRTRALGKTGWMDSKAVTTSIFRTGVQSLLTPTHLKTSPTEASAVTVHSFLKFKF